LIVSSEITAIQRAVQADGSVQLSAGNCTFHYGRLKPGVLRVTIVGNDRGQFGAAAVDEVTEEFKRFGEPLALFFDLRGTPGPSTPVMELWTAWFAANHGKLRRVVLLVPPDSKVLHLTVSIAQHLSRTGNLLRICADTQEFERAIADELRDRNSTDRREH
jgi:hypothetical protein